MSKLERDHDLWPAADRFGKLHGPLLHASIPSGKSLSDPNYAAALLTSAMTAAFERGAQWALEAHAAAVAAIEKAKGKR